MTTPLVEFIRARLDEDEATARTAMDGRGWQTNEPWSGTWTTGEDGWPGAVEDTTGGLVVHDEGSPNAGQAQHIARHDPARVLRDIRAKQTVLFRHVTYATRVERAGDLDLFGLPERLACDGCGCDDGRPRTPSLDDCPELRALAAPYADHSDYRSEWSP